MAITIINRLEVIPPATRLPHWVTMKMTLRSDRGRGERVAIRYELRNDHPVWFLTRRGPSKFILRGADVRFGGTDIRHRGRLVWAPNANPELLMMPLRARFRAVLPEPGPVRQSTDNLTVLP